MTTYRDAGVDIDAGDETVRRIKPMVRSTFTPGVLETTNWNKIQP